MLSICDQCKNQSICLVFDLFVRQNLVESITISQCEHYHGPALDRRERMESIVTEVVEADEEDKAVGSTHTEGEADEEEEEHLPAGKPQSHIITVEMPSESEPPDHDTVIIVHPDLNGVVACVGLILMEKLEGARILFSTPARINETLDEVNREHIQKVYVLGIAYDVRQTFRIDNFLNQMFDKLKIWYDNHGGWENFNINSILNNDSVEMELVDAGFQINEQAETTLEIFSEQEELITIARQLVKGEADSEPALTILESYRSNMKDYRLKFDIIRYLKTYFNHGAEAANNSASYYRLKRAARDAKEIHKNTQDLIKAGELKSKVYVMRASKGRVDITQAMLAAYEQAPFSIVLSRRDLGKKCSGCNTRDPALTPQGECGKCGSKVVSANIIETTHVGTNLEEISLPEIFDLAGGARFRIQLPGNRVVETMKKLNGLKV